MTGFSDTATLNYVKIEGPAPDALGDPVTFTFTVRADVQTDTWIMDVACVAAGTLSGHAPAHPLISRNYFRPDSPDDPRPDVSIRTGMGLLARPMRGSGGCQPSGQPER